MAESVWLVNLVVTLSLADKMDQCLANLWVEMLDNVLFLCLREALQKAITHLRQLQLLVDLRRAARFYSLIRHR